MGGQRINKQCYKCGNYKHEYRRITPHIKQMLCVDDDVTIDEQKYALCMQCYKDVTGARTNLAIKKVESCLRKDFNIYIALYMSSATC